MKDDRRQQEILSVIARTVRHVLEKEKLEFQKLQEVRMRVGKPLVILYDNRERILPTEGAGRHLVTKEEMQETLDYISRYSPYAYEQEIRQGFLTIEGGHRIGVTGKAVLENKQVKTIQHISSINIRVAHEIQGCADEVMNYITENGQVYHTLIISPPRCGKTTLLRDIIRQISDGNKKIKGCTVGVVDERSELAGCYHGIPQNNLGIRTDVLDCCPKSEGMMLLIRSMSPQVIVVDEIGTAEDIHALEYAMQCGCKLIASVHGADMEEVKNKPMFETLIKKKRFQRYVVLEDVTHPGEIAVVYDERGNTLYSGERRNHSFLGGVKCIG